MGQSDLLIGRKPSDERAVGVVDGEVRVVGRSRERAVVVVATIDDFFAGRAGERVERFAVRGFTNQHADDIVNGVGKVGFGGHFVVDLRL